MDTQIMNIAYKFIYLFGELSFLFIGITFLVQLIQQKLNPEKIQAIRWGKKGIWSYFIAALLASVTPFCSCSTIPMLKGMIQSRVGFGTALTFLFTSPLLNPIIIGIFLSMLGARVTIIYIVIALAFSIISSIILEFFNFEKYLILDYKTSSCQISSETTTPNKEVSCCNKNSKTSPIKKAIVEALKDFRSLLPHLIVSCLIGAFIYENIPTEFLQKYIGKDNFFSIPLAAIIGIPLYVRTSVLIPLSVILIEKGVSLGAMMALIIGGGGASLPELILLKSLFKKELLIAFVVVIMTMAIAAGYTTLLLIG